VFQTMSHRTFIKTGNPYLFSSDLSDQVATTAHKHVSAETFFAIQWNELQPNAERCQHTANRYKAR